MQTQSSIAHRSKTFFPKKKKLFGKRLQFERFSCKIEMLAEMSERLKERDWKSRDGGESSGGSNPLLCAMKDARMGVFFHGAEKRERKSARFAPPAASIDYRRAARVTCSNHLFSSINFQKSFDFSRKINNKRQKFIISIFIEIMNFVVCTQGTSFCGEYFEEGASFFSACLLTLVQKGV